MSNLSPSPVSPHELELDTNTVFPDLAHAARTVELARRAERQNLSRELHDTVVQPLTALAAALELLPPQPLSAEALMAHAQAWKQLVYESLDALRRTVAGLQTHPHTIQALPEALQMYLVPLFDSRGIHVTVDAENWPDHLPADSAFHLYLAVREAVLNADKHGHASQISIVMCGYSTLLSLVIVDNGIGFRWPDSTHPHASSADSARPTGTGLGLVSMRERVHLLGGELSISSAPGEGARIEIAVPRSASDVNRSSTAVEALAT